MSTDRVERARLSQVGLSYGPLGEGSVRALDRVDLSLFAGQVVALVGPNGSGKTSIMALLAGRVAPSTGEVRIAGFDGPSELRGRNRRALHASVSLVTQDPELDPEMEVGEVLSLLAVLHGVPSSDRRSHVESALEGAGLTPHRDKRVDELSGGLRRRLHIAGSMMHKSQVLLMDEPGAGLDDQGERFLWSRVAQSAQAGSAVLVITHDLHAVSAHADEVIVLDGGRVSQRGTPEELARGHEDLVAALRSRVGTPRPPGPRRPGRGRGKGPA